MKISRDHEITDENKSLSRDNGGGIKCMNLWPFRASVQLPGCMVRIHSSKGPWEMWMYVDGLSGAFCLFL